MDEFKHSMDLLEITPQGTSYIGADDCVYDSLEDAIHSGVLHFCGCGMPRTVLKKIHDGLVNIQKSLKDRPLSPLEYQQWLTKETEIHGSEANQFFFYYWADAMEFTDHGSSVPGWLTEKGIALVHLISALPEDSCL